MTVCQTHADILEGIVKFIPFYLLKIACLLFRELSSLAKCKVREKTTQWQFVKNKVCETLCDLGFFTHEGKKRK